VRRLQVLKISFRVQNAQFISVTQLRRIGEDASRCSRTLFNVRNSAAVAEPEHAACESDNMQRPHHSSLGNANRLVLVPNIFHIGTPASSWFTDVCHIELHMTFFQLTAFQWNECSEI
jgi:hypothetical protein